MNAIATRPVPDVASSDVLPPKEKNAEQKLDSDESQSPSSLELELGLTAGIFLDPRLAPQHWGINE